MLSMTMALLMFAMPITTGAQAAPAAVTFTVNSTLDHTDDLTVPGTCHTAANTCTLLAAVMQANWTSGAGATILLPSGTYALTIPAAGADGEENGDPNLTTPGSGILDLRSSTLSQNTALFWGRHRQQRDPESKRQHNFWQRFQHRGAAFTPPLARYT